MFAYKLFAYNQTRSVQQPAQQCPAKPRMTCINPKYSCSSWYLACCKVLCSHHTTCGWANIICTFLSYEYMIICQSRQQQTKPTYYVSAAQMQPAPLTDFSDEKRYSNIIILTQHMCSGMVLHPPIWFQYVEKLNLDFDCSILSEKTRLQTTATWNEK